MKLLKSLEQDIFTAPVPIKLPRVEKGIPPPGPKLLTKRTPILDLEPGDSFLLPADVRPANLYALAKRLKLKIQIAKTEDGERCWRIK